MRNNRPIFQIDYRDPSWRVYFCVCGDFIYKNKDGVGICQNCGETYSKFSMAHPQTEIINAPFELLEF